MKIRTDFVTNSSSSSFILGFKSEEAIEQTLKNNMAVLRTNNIFNKVLSDCQEAFKMDLDRMIEYAMEEEEWYVRFYIEYISDKTNKMSHEERERYINSQEFINDCNTEVSRRLDKIWKQATDKDYNVFVILEYGDEYDEGDIEFDIAPRLSCLIKSYSHH